MKKSIIVLITLLVLIIVGVVSETPTYSSVESFSGTGAYAGQNNRKESGTNSQSGHVILVGIGMFLLAVCGKRSLNSNEA